MHKFLKILLIIVIVLAVIALLAFFGLKKLWHNITTDQMAPDNYTVDVKTGGELETKYLASGTFETKTLVAEYPDDTDIGKITVWYPAELETGSGKYPVVLFVNGTGVGASRYAPVFQHMASWGFIAVGNEDPSSWEGKKANATLAWLLAENENKDGSYREKVHPIAAAEWVENNPIPTVVAYGACDKVQPFLASRRLEVALKENGVDYRYFVLEHSGHGLQNDSAVSRLWMEAVEEYLDKYMPVE